MQDILNILASSGLMGIVLAVMTLVAIYFILERKSTYTKESLDLKAFSDTFAGYIQQAQGARTAADREQAYENARQFCLNERGETDRKGNVRAKGAVAEVFQRALEHRDKGPATLRNMLNNHIDLAILPRLRRGLRPLNAIGKGAPMVGLLGTVMGMMRAFGSIATAGSGVNPKDLAGDIGLALGTTFLGLFVAIPVVFAGAFFRAKVEQFEIDLDRYSEYCLDLLYAGEKTILDETLAQHR